MPAENRYNLRLWLDEFKSRMRDCLKAQIKAIAWREGLSAGGHGASSLISDGSATTKLRLKRPRLAKVP
jgi:hypothetical protein